MRPPGRISSRTCILENVHLAEHPCELSPPNRLTSRHKEYSKNDARKGTDMWPTLGYLHLQRLLATSSMVHGDLQVLDCGAGTAILVHYGRPLVWCLSSCPRIRTPRIARHICISRCTPSPTTDVHLTTLIYDHVHTRIQLA